MAGKSGNQTNAVDLRFLENPAGLSFFQVAAGWNAVLPDKPRWATRPAQRTIRFSFVRSPRWICPVNAPALMNAPTQPAKPRLMVNFLGLLGPQGPMPLHITDYIQP
jgi:type VI secretion system protein ImpH